MTDSNRERPTSSARDAARPSDRHFGLTMSAVLAAYAAYSYAQGKPRILAVITATVVAAVALLRPVILRWPNVVWTRLGDVLERIVSPIVLAVVFVVVITPIALVMRVVGRDPLRRRIDRAASSYWIPRADPPAADSWRRQF